MTSARCARRSAPSCASEIQPRVREIDEGCEYPRDLYARDGRAQPARALGARRKYGGRCESDVSWCAYVEELAKVSGTVSLMAAYVKLVSLPMTAGRQRGADRSACCPALLSGEQLGSFALSEPNVGSDPGALETRAERHGDTWVLNGEKRFIGNAGLSDVYVVFARTGDEGAKGVSAFIVDGHADGVSSREAAHDGHAGLAARRAALRGRRGAGGEPARPRGRRLPDRDGDLRPLAPDGRRAGGRPRRRARSTSRSTTRRAATRSASRCWPTRACSSSSPTWRPTSPRRGR